MSNLFSRFNISDYAVLFGGLAVLAVMIALGPGQVEEDEPKPAARSPTGPQEPGFWETWPGALVTTIGGGALVYVLLILYSATHH